MKKRNIIGFLSVVLVSSSMLFSCNKEDDKGDEVGPNEQLLSVVLTGKAYFKYDKSRYYFTCDDATNTATGNVIGNYEVTIPGGTDGAYLITVDDLYGKEYPLDSDEFTDLTGMGLEVLFGVNYFLPTNTDEMDLKKYTFDFTSLIITDDVYRISYLNKHGLLNLN
jgi:hypothetical protein